MYPEKLLVEVAPSERTALQALLQLADTRLLALRTAEKLLVEVAPSERTALQALLQLADTRLLALRTAEKLLVEVAPSERTALQALLQLATRQKAPAERVLELDRKASPYISELHSAGLAELRDRGVCCLGLDEELA
ncbi:TPR repeat-containing protein [Operophtera brumata]|uniref:TPR repeat-containing protein n=1 Tax=Operophtera brumata TaxID=104452 RepID=A0A0L7L3K8_OPEBR|nr:TPR repeat-containing protein [Operophtera brumata]